MTIFLLGMNHNTAGLGLREQLAIPDASLPALLAELSPLTQEAVVLSTCNRVELYCVADSDVVAQALDILCRFVDADPAQVAQYVYVRRDDEAARHLIEVAAGLDSVIIGEPQILGQVRDAWEMARRQGYTGPYLNTLFRFALQAGKDVRSRTAISRGATSVAHAAVELSRATFGSLDARQVLVLGAGETGRLAVLNLLSAGATQVYITNRTHAKAEALASKLNGVAVPFSELPRALAQIDVLITCSSAPEVLVEASTLRQVLQDRPDRPLLVIDISVPRNVDPAARELSSVALFDMDDIQRICEQNRHARAMAARGASATVARWVDRYGAWRRERDVVPLLRRMRERAETIRREELADALRKMPDLSEREREALEIATSTIVNRLLHEPTIRLKMQAHATSPAQAGNTQPEAASPAGRTADGRP